MVNNKNSESTFSDNTRKVKNVPKPKFTQNEIVKTWITGQKSVTMIIERKLAEEYELTDPQYVVLERKQEGILIRKLG